MNLFRYLLLPVVFVLVSACNDTAPDKLVVDPRDIGDPYERWKAYKFDNYSMVEEIFCLCDRPFGAHKA